MPRGSKQDILARRALVEPLWVKHVPAEEAAKRVCLIGKKLKTSTALDEDLLKWIDQLVRTRRFANRTQAIEFALQKLKEST